MTNIFVLAIRFFSVLVTNQSEGGTHCYTVYPPIYTVEIITEVWSNQMAELLPRGEIQDIIPAGLIFCIGSNRIARNVDERTLEKIVPRRIDNDIYILPN